MATTRKVASFLIVPLFLMCLLATAGSLMPAAAQVQVNSANPNTAAQATVNLNVIIKGKGFKKGAVAKWQVTGTEDPGGVTVNSTTFVSSTELVANVDVAETAVISLYDIAVRNSDGRTGKGTELFSVTAKGTGQAEACSIPVPSQTSTNSCSGTGAGCLDTTFDGDGWAYVDTTGNPDLSQDIEEVFAVAIQPDGKIVTAGLGGSPAGFTVIRYNTDGTLDPTFGSGGVVSLPPFAGTSAAWTIRLQPDGKMVVAGDDGGGRMAAVRLNVDGSLDTSFGSGGIALIGFGRKDGHALDAVVQSDGKIVLVGSAGSDWGIVRLNTDGTLDPAFANGGTLIVKATGGGARSVLMQTVNIGGTPVERILVGGSVNGNFAVMRFTLAGGLDSSFGPKSNGKVLTSFCGNSNESVRALALDAAGNILAGGSYTGYDGITGLNFIVVRYSADGILDTSFGRSNSGYNFVDFQQSNDNVFGVAVQADGKIVLSGSTESRDGTFRAFALARFNSDGSLDSSFGQGGVAVAHLAADHDAGRDVALQSDGKIVVVGKAGDNGNQSAVVRFWH